MMPLLKLEENIPKKVKLTKQNAGVGIIILTLNKLLTEPPVLSPHI